MSEEDPRALYESPPVLTEEEIRDLVVTIRSAVASPRPLDDSANAASRQVLRDFCLRQFTGQPPSAAALSWLADAFSRILEHEAVDLKEAFGIVWPKHRPSDDEWPRTEVAIWVHFATERGVKQSQAFLLAAELFGRDVRQIRAYCKTSAHRVQDLNPDVNWPEYFMVKRKPLP